MATPSEFLCSIHLGNEEWLQNEHTFSFSEKPWDQLLYLGGRDGKGCECVCKYTQACISWYVFGWGKRSTLGVSLYHLPWDRASCPPMQSPDSLAHELSGFLPVSSYVSAEVLGLWLCTVWLHVLPFHGRHSGTTDMHHHVWLHVGSWDHISGPCTCVTSSLPLSQLPRCPSRFFLKPAKH